MTLIDGDRIITAQLYDDEYEEFTEKKMSIIDYINAYTDEGVTKADVVEQTRWIPVSERLPEKNGNYLIQVNSSDGTAIITFMIVDHYNEDGTWLHCDNKTRKVIAWMPLPEPYKAESEEKK